MMNETKIYIIPATKIISPMMVVGNWGDIRAKKKLVIMLIHSQGQIFWDRIHHHFKCNASRNPTKDSRAIYKEKTSSTYENTIDGATGLQYVDGMDAEEEEEEEEGGR